jgi:hypothetical protein
MYNFMSIKKHIYITHPQHSFLFILLFAVLVGQAWGLIQAEQVLYHWATLLDLKVHFLKAELNEKDKKV